MDKETYKKEFTPDDAVGWKSIDDALGKIYGADAPRHYGPLSGVHYAAGGPDPLDGISIYDNPEQEPHLHLVSYGMSELYYNEAAADGEFSKWGFEFTLRLVPFAEDNGDPGWAMQVFNNLARYVIQSGRWFEENQLIPANGPVRLNTDTQITGFVTVLDPELGKIDTPYGEVSFIQLVGVTQKELDMLKEDLSTDKVALFLENMKKENPMFLTDLTRK